MTAERWADKPLNFRPGSLLEGNVGVSAATWNTRINEFYTDANLAFWHPTESGTYANLEIRFRMTDLIPSAPTGDLTDPDNSSFNWTYLESIFAMSNLGRLGSRPVVLKLMTSSSFTAQWMIDAGLTWVNNGGTGSRQVRWDLPEARDLIVNIFQAIFTKFSSNRKFWAIALSELLMGNGTGLPASALSIKLGMAEVFNRIYDLSGGTIAVFVGGNTAGYSEIRAALYPLIGYLDPDLKAFSSGCTTTCTAGTLKAVFQSSFENRMLGQLMEANGLSPVVYPDTWPNVLGYNSSTPSHVFNPTEYLGYLASDTGDYPGVIPVHLVGIWPAEYGGVSTMTLAACIAAMNRFGYSSTDPEVGGTIPALPANYSTTPAASGSPTLPTVQTADITKSQGSAGTGKSITKPTNLADGDHVIIWQSTANCAANSGTNFSNLSGFTQFASVRETGRTDVPEICGWIKYIPTASAEPSSYTFDAAVTYDVAAIRVSNMDPNDPLGFLSSNNSSATSVSSLVIPGVTTSDDNSVLLSVLGFRDNSPSSIANNDTSMTKIYEHDPSAATRDTAAFYEAVATQADTGTRSFDWTTATRVAGFTVELRGIPSAGDTTAPTLDDPDEATGSAGGQTSIEWTIPDASDDTAVTEYDLEYSTDGSTGIFLATITQAEKTAEEGSNSYSYLQTGLAAGSGYYLRYRARDAAGNQSDWSDWSSQVATDTPVDNAVPTGGGIDSASFDSDTGDVTVVATQAHDNVTADADIRYYAVLAIDPATPDFTDRTYGGGKDQLTIIIPDLPDGTYNIGTVAVDETGNYSTSTATEQVVVGQPVVTGTTAVLAANTGSPQSAVDGFMFIAPKGIPIPSVNVTEPDGVSSGIPVTLNSDGTLTISQSGDAGTYHGFVVNTDLYDVSGDIEDLWLAFFEVDLA